MTSKPSFYKKWIPLVPCTVCTPSPGCATVAPKLAPPPSGPLWLRSFRSGPLLGTTSATDSTSATNGPPPDAPRSACAHEKGQEVLSYVQYKKRNAILRGFTCITIYYVASYDKERGGKRPNSRYCYQKKYLEQQTKCQEPPRRNLSA